MNKNCRSCGAEIVWVLMDTGKTMPIDADPNPLGNVAVRRVGRDNELHGRVVTGTKPLDPTSERMGMSHFVICPAADKHRKRGRR